MDEDDNRKICGACLYYEAPSIEDGEVWLCGNEMSKGFGLHTGHSNGCEGWRGISVDEDSEKEEER